MCGLEFSANFEWIYVSYLNLVSSQTQFTPFQVLVPQEVNTSLFCAPFTFLNLLIEVIWLYIRLLSLFECLVSFSRFLKLDVHASKMS